MPPKMRGGELSTTLARPKRPPRKRKGKRKRRPRKKPTVDNDGTGNIMKQIKTSIGDDGKVNITFEKANDQPLERQFLEKVLATLVEVKNFIVYLRRLDNSKLLQNAGFMKLYEKLIDFIHSLGEFQKLMRKIEEVVRKGLEKRGSSDDRDLGSRKSHRYSDKKTSPRYDERSKNSRHDREKYRSNYERDKGKPSTISGNRKRRYSSSSSSSSSSSDSSSSTWSDSSLSTPERTSKFSGERNKNSSYHRSSKDRDAAKSKPRSEHSKYRPRDEKQSSKCEPSTSTGYKRRRYSSSSSD